MSPAAVIMYKTLQDHTQDPSSWNRRAKHPASDDKSQGNHQRVIVKLTGAGNRLSLIFSSYISCSVALLCCAVTVGGTSSDLTYNLLNTTRCCWMLGKDNPEPLLINPFNWSQLVESFLFNALKETLWKRLTDTSPPPTRFLMRWMNQRQLQASSYYR